VTDVWPRCVAWPRCVVTKVGCVVTEVRHDRGVSWPRCGPEVPWPRCVVAMAEVWPMRQRCTVTEVCRDRWVSRPMGVATDVCRDRGVS